MLVAKLVNIFTNPDTIYIQQEDPPEHNVNMTTGEDTPENVKVESFMYFIRNGRFTVHVKDAFITRSSTLV